MQWAEHFRALTISRILEYSYLEKAQDLNCTNQCPLSIVYSTLHAADNNLFITPPISGCSLFIGNTAALDPL